MRKRAGLFEGWWRDPVTRERLERVSRAELRTAYRLWARHADIRQGRVNERGRR